MVVIKTVTIDPYQLSRLDEFHTMQTILTCRSYFEFEDAAQPMNASVLLDDGPLVVR